MSIRDCDCAAAPFRRMLAASSSRTPEIILEQVALIRSRLRTGAGAREGGLLLRISSRLPPRRRFAAGCRSELRTVSDANVGLER